MLHQLDDAIEQMLRERLPYSPEQLDIAFETPDSTWGAGLNKPTVNVFLWDIRRSVDESRAGRAHVELDGARVWRQMIPRIEFQYLLTAWTKEIADEHELLGECLIAVLGCQVLDQGLRPGFSRPEDQPPTVRVARTDAKDSADFWGAVEGKLKPGLSIVVSASIDPVVGERDPAAPFPARDGFRVDTYDRTLGKGPLAERRATARAENASTATDKGAS